MSHPVVFAEIHGADGAALRRFYAGLFGWPFQEMPGADYGMAPPEAGGIGVGEHADDRAVRHARRGQRRRAPEAFGGCERGRDVVGSDVERHEARPALGRRAHADPDPAGFRRRHPVVGARHLLERPANSPA